MSKAQGFLSLFGTWEVSLTDDEPVTNLDSPSSFFFTQLPENSLKNVDDAGDSSSADHLPIACRDAVAILFMFDLTSRCTLNRYACRVKRMSRFLSSPLSY